jgi:hypothetical protein
MEEGKTNADKRKKDVYGVEGDRISPYKCCKTFFVNNP